MMPMVELNPRFRARLPMVSASCGFFTPPPTTVRRYVVDRNLQPLQPGAIEALNAVCHQKIAVRDQPGDHAPFANAVDDLVELGVKQGLATTDGNNRCPQRSQLVHPLEHGFGRNRFGKIVVFVAVFAGQIAAPRRDDVSQQRMVGRGERARDHAHPAQITVERLQTTPYCRSDGWHGYYLLKHRDG